MDIVEESGASKLVLDVGNVAKTLQISNRTVHNMLKRGTLLGKKVGNRWYIDPASLRQAFGLKASGEAPIRDARPLEVPDIGRVPEVLQGLEENVAYVRAALGSVSSIVRSGLAQGLQTIYPPRRGGGESDAAIQKLLREARGEILLQGVSLRQFFHDKPFRQALWEKLNGDPPAQVHALLIDPLGRAARARMYVEESIQRAEKDHGGLEDPRKSGLFKDIERSIETITAFRAALKDRAHLLEPRFYDCTPFAFFVLTEDGLLIEQYHFGRQESPVGGCIGELVPLVAYTPKSEMYRIMRNSFNHLWNRENPFVDVKTLEEMVRAVAGKAAATGVPRRPPPARGQRDTARRP